ncbi:MAG: sulfotransferase domain-containing protein [Alphaproteobacteria bacterium]|jgi:hypothetical protein|nr:sulfotransferase domain-containing protein [Alphaproteobacteria bacterium]MBT4084998.1 sulfotransferase domain-containing protein [Alphaproteobacteria bacterium]MBT4545546.1 sulfotransferase domain-containing protein [Alphaproteobacteria bacterium]MBT7745449.1 sulfotransferase domain-containing protein [Alphaproteobacteria bacterium]
MAGILWLASYPKSGNTWLRVFLYNLLTNARTVGAVSQLGQFNYSDTHIPLFQSLTTKPVTEMTVEETAVLRPVMHRKLAASSPNTTFVKTHCALTEFGGQDQITMDATSGAMYVVRNPLDVCLSMAPHFGISIDEAIDWLADSTFMAGADDGEVPYLISSWSRHVDSWTREGENASLHIVRFEDMTYKPGPTFKSVAKFMGLKPPAEVLKRAIKLSSFDSVRKQEDENGFIERSVHSEKFFRSGKANQWKSELSKAQVDRVVEANHDMMKKFNYLPPEYK